MRRTALLAAILLWPAFALADDRDAKTVAQEILNKGSALFDSRSAANMAATYAEDATLSWVDKDKDTDKYRSQSKQGRSEIETMYADLFRDMKEATTSRNTVEFAKFLAPDLLVIHGTFKPDASKDLEVGFLQERVKQGDQWLIQGLRVYIISKE